jgi:hypothetical protein
VSWSLATSVEQQIPPLRCGMTTKVRCGMTTKVRCGMTTKGTNLNDFEVRTAPARFPLAVLKVGLGHFMCRMKPNIFAPLPFEMC